MHRIFCIVFVALFTVTANIIADETLRAGTAVIDITPQQFSVTVNGGFLPWQTDKVIDPLYARCLMLQSDEPVVFVVIDSCMLPLELVDRMKAMIAEKTKIPAGRIMISATHCHSAPSLVAALGTPADENYVAFLPDKIVQLVAEAQKNLEPAKVGWAVGEDRNNVYIRRFYMRKGTAATNPFSGKKNDRAQMNPGHANKNKIARTGPADTTVSVLSVMTRDDRPLAVLANYSTHYAGVSGGLSGDYFGVFSSEIQRMIAEKTGDDEKMSKKFLGIMTNGTSGDANCIDFLNPNRKFTYQTVGTETAQAAMAVWPTIQYFDRLPIRMTEKRIEITNRVPSAEEVQAAKEHLAKLDGKPIKTGVDVYAQSTVMMENWPKTSTIPIQAIRIGELGITALPAEVYGITGLEIKARSPFAPTFNISMANGYFGYVPPPEQHRLGGYNTWRTQTSCLEENAETAIKNTAIELLRSLHAAGPVE